MSHLAGSNCGPRLYERRALPTELRWQMEYLLNSARTYFIKNSTETPNVNADSVLRKLNSLGK